MSVEARWKKETQRYGNIESAVSNTALWQLSEQVFYYDWTTLTEHFLNTIQEQQK